MAQVTGGEGELVFEVVAKDGVVNIAVLELMPCFIVGGEKLIGHLLMPHAADGGDELVHIERVELGLEELRPQDVFVAEA